MEQLSIEKLSNEVEQLKIIPLIGGVRYRRKQSAVHSVKTNDFFVVLYVVQDEIRVVLWDTMRNQEFIRSVRKGDYRIEHSHLGFVGYISKEEWSAAKNLYEEI